MHQAQALGATIVSPVRESGDAGRTAVIEDPAGLKTGFWQANKMIGAERINEDGAMVWNEITVWEGQKAVDFYTALLAWEATKLDDYESGYWMLKNGERNAGGILQMTEDWTGIDPHWMNYIHVDDLDSTANKVSDNGGTVVFGTDSESIGKLKLCSAPSGVQFTLLQTKAFDAWVE
ncbi:MAG: VOC family protein [Chloroflexota bacterium]